MLLSKHKNKYMNKKIVFFLIKILVYVFLIEVIGILINIFFICH